MALNYTMNRKKLVVSVMVFWERLVIFFKDLELESIVLILLYNELSYGRPA